MSFDDILAVIILIIAYLFTWILFVFSLKIIKIIDKEKIYHLNEIKDRLFGHKGIK